MSPRKPKTRPDADPQEKRKAADRPEPGHRMGVQPRQYPDLLDDTLDDSFPASDPPSWAGQGSPPTAPRPNGT